MLNFLLKPSNLKSNFTLTLGYLNPTLNGPDLDGKRCSENSVASAQEHSRKT